MMMLKRNNTQMELEQLRLQTLTVTICLMEKMMTLIAPSPLSRQMIFSNQFSKEILPPQAKTQRKTLRTTSMRQMPMKWKLRIVEALF